MTDENARPRLTSALQKPFKSFDPASDHHIGLFVGEGIGEEVVPVAVRLLERLSDHFGRSVVTHEGGLIGLPAMIECGSSLSEEVKAQAREVFGLGGALFCGPGGDRFVYEVRREFDLYCKFTPIEPFPELRGAGSVRAAMVERTDIIAVRENMGGIYQGEWSDERGDDGRTAHHRFHYREADVCRILEVAARLAATRRGWLTIVLKPGGIPSITHLWRDCADPIARRFGVRLNELEIDNAVYQLIADPGQFDVLVSPNMFGDVLADCGSLLLASRGLSYSGNFNDRGNGVYQTGHGAARAIAGMAIANPTGQILSLGMMLRESFDWPEADELLRTAVRQTLAEGIVTSDVAATEQAPVGTTEFGDAVGRRLDRLLDQHRP
jgi:3-isopropylmalate dehydrogenase